MLQKLQTDVFVFSGMKTYTQLKEATLLLLDENNQIKPYAKFEQDILKINTTYNQNYLQAEHQHAIAAAQSAAQYNEYMQDAESYNLQIRTAGDDKVRTSHAELNGITLPANHEFWNTHYTPFDWRCRCRIIQVLKNKYATTDDGIANAAAQQAIPEMFKYNPAVQGVIFPPKHPYYPQHCNGAKLNVSKLIGFATWLLSAETDRCKAKNILKKEAENKITSKQLAYEKAMQPLLKRNMIRNVGNNKSIKITFTKKGNAHVANDVLNNINSFTKKDLQKIYTYVKEAEHIRSSALYKKRKDDIQRFYYFYDNKKEVYYNIAEAVKKRKYGQIKLERYLYSITKEIPQK